MANRSFDLVVLGAGPGGYVAAIRAAQLGLKTAIVEREALGGVCLNWGCIPTKALLRSSEIFHLLQRLDEFGLSAGEITFDLGKVVARSRQVAERLSTGVKSLMKKNKIEVVMGAGKLAGKGELVVTASDQTQTLSAKHIILATGARARALPGIEPDSKRVWTYREAMVPESLPKSLLVIGSGAIGIEFASFYRTLGTEVTVVEILDRILPIEDAEISRLAEKAFKKQGMTVMTGTTVTRIKNEDDSVTATIKRADGKTETKRFERAILAVGITGNVEGFGLEDAGITIEKGHVVTDPWGRTGVNGLYAIGDVTGPPWLAHKAMHEGVTCVEAIAGVKGIHPIDVTRIPGCTYSNPQIASVGLTEDQARAAGYQLKVGRFPFVGNGKAIALGEPDGLVKTVFDQATGELLGAHMIGAEVTELIQGYTIARTLEATEADLLATVFPHPTLSEMMHEAVLAADGRTLHF